MSQIPQSPCKKFHSVLIKCRIQGPSQDCLRERAVRQQNCRIPRGYSGKLHDSDKLHDFLGHELCNIIITGMHLRRNGLLASICIIDNEHSFERISVSRSFSISWLTVFMGFSTFSYLIAARVCIYILASYRPYSELDYVTLSPALLMLSPLRPFAYHSRPLTDYKLPHILTPFPRQAQPTTNLLHSSRSHSSNTSILYILSQWLPLRQYVRYVFTQPPACQDFIDMCKIPQGCMLEVRGATEPSCNPEDLGCICESSNSLEHNLLFDAHCLFKECTQEVGRGGQSFAT